MKNVRHFIVAALALVAAAACGNDRISPAEPIATFIVQVGADRFNVQVTEQADYERLVARMQSGNAGVINGRVARGDGGFNGPWSWHLIPASIEVPDLSIELCDGTPSYVEAHLDEWMRSVKNYCPWGARVVGVKPLAP
jgi:hypothetical protein